MTSQDPNQSQQRISSDELLLWLNDRLGTTMSVFVELIPGGNLDEYSVPLGGLDGELEHDLQEDGLPGCYWVGDISLQLSSLGSLPIHIGDRGKCSVSIGLSNEAILWIVEPLDEDEAEDGDDA